MQINKTVLLVIVILVAILLLGAWLSGSDFGISPTSTTTPSSATQTTQTTTKTTTTKSSTTKPGTSAPVVPSYFKGSNSINTLLTLDSSYSCSFTSSNRSGAFVLGTKKWRGALSNNMTMIDDGTYIYLWENGATTGLKVLATSGAAVNAVVTRGGVDPYAALSYSCAAWKVDATRFVPPTGIVFKNASGDLYQ